MTGFDQVINHGPWAHSFYGSSSGFAFVLRTIDHFRKKDSETEPAMATIVATLFNGPLPDKAAVGLHDLGLQALPSHDTALVLVSQVFSNCHPLFQFLHQGDFREMLDDVYSHTIPTTEPHLRFMPLCHFVLALGYLFTTSYHARYGCHTAVRQA